MKPRQVLLSASRVLYYEVDMLNETARALSSQKNNGVFLNNALLESFLIHLRNLIDFLYLPKCNKDDILAQDFFPNPEDWLKLRPKQGESLDTAKRKTNKLLAHLTYSRLRIPKDQAKWDFMYLRNEIVSRIQVFLGVCPSNG